jgi:TolB-like protein
MLACTKSAIMAAAGVLVAGTAAAPQAPSEPQRPVVAIMDFTNSSLVDHAMYEPFSAGIAAMLLADLSRNPNIEVIERERLREILDEIALNQSGTVDSAAAVQAGKILGAQHMIFGVFVIDRHSNLRLDARAVNVETSRVEHVESVTDDADDLLRAVGQLGDQLSAGLELPAPRQGSQEDPGPAIQGQVLANLKYARALLAEDEKNAPVAVELYQGFLADTPADYAPALRQLAEQRIRLLTGRY